MIPNKYRVYLGERIWLAKGVDGCLNIFTQSAWEEYARKYIMNRSLTDEKARQLIRFALGGSRELEIDRMGRINLPQDHIEFAGIEKEVVFVGFGDYIELWGKDAFGKKADPANLDLSGLMHDAEVAAGEG